MLGGVTDQRFDELVDEAIDGIPEEFLRELGNVVILVADRNPDEPELLGLYEGVPLTERTADHWGMPDVIHVYRDALLDFCTSEEDLVEQVRITVVHEVGHFFGMDEDDLERLGYA